ncbi:hypothetical protein VI34_05970 [Methylophilales bacterium MBRSG12]|uniref:Uncharacterized protein n=1 Tax=Methylophilales bacterium MBRS-H7 TaxID=1623450 RepID=A0A0H4IYZ3_9PROT|nr:hypothetical protein UZ34_04355 [Methylophilales bacterium MBRSF5]AKO66216.1 hypothetical protein VI33_05975 [Methylophilales bacterium MBRS-H7]AKO67534.1 hypothetical protein VI34_05970 [Methylophilales bacterium MBRSG12]
MAASDVMEQMYPKDSSSSVTYVCTPEISSGVKFDKSSNTFSSTEFSVDLQYIISKYSHWVINYFGQNVDLTSGQGCDDSIMSETGFHRLSCNIIGGQMLVDLQEMKFVRTNMMGYTGVNNHEEQSKLNNPFIEVGACSKVIAKSS